MDLETKDIPRLAESAFTGQVQGQTLVPTWLLAVT